MTDRANREFNEALLSGFRKAGENLNRELAPILEALDKSGLFNYIATVSAPPAPTTPQERMQDAFALDRALKEAKAAQIRKRVKKYW